MVHSGQNHGAHNECVVVDGQVPLAPCFFSHIDYLSKSSSRWTLSSHCCLHHELCLCWVCWCVLREVILMQCVSRCPLPKRQHNTQPCFHVMVCTNASCCMVGGECERMLWRGGVVGAGEKKKKGRGKHMVKQKQKGLFPKPLFLHFPFFHLFFIHSFFLAFHSSTITPFLSMHTPVFHASHMSAFMVNQKHK